MYHQLMLEALLDVLNVHPYGEAALAPLRDAAMRMAGHLRAILHPGGLLPLFSDATREIAPPPASTLAYAKAVLGEATPPRDAYPHAGVFVLRAPGAHVVCDAGPIGPDHLPAHAHADIFSFEASFGGLLFVTDTGVFEYAAGERRQHDRSTAAHNTVGIDGVDQAECWGSFRVARRFPPTQVRFEARGDVRRLSGVFDGWTELIGDGIVHRRQFALEPGQLDGGGPGDGHRHAPRRGPTPSPSRGAGRGKRGRALCAHPRRRPGGSWTSEARRCASSARATRRVLARR